MKTLFKLGLIAFVLLCLGAAQAGAQGLSISGDEHGMHDRQHHNHSHHAGHVHSGPSAPVSIMGDHLHDKGEWMVSYRFMRMEMKDNRDGTNDLSPTEISGDIANRFFGIAGQPSTLRIVPIEMTMDMHMLGAMYGLSDNVTLMAMVNYKRNEMDHITFQAAAPDTELGRFTTRTSGFGDTRIAGLIGLYESGAHKIHVRAGLSLPTGSIDERDDILAPNGTTPTVRAPYTMQLGSGTYDLEPGITYTGHGGKWGWGSQALAQIRLGENDEDYSLGDKYRLAAWGAYQWSDALSTALRLSGEYESKIDGIDSNIVGPVQTADPDNYGGRRLELGLGGSYAPDGFLQGHEFGAELSLPLYQNLNGPQMERDYAFTLGYRKTF